jgi:ubiquinone/menaquinone biosynthesis C-methylase UbiE
VELAKSGLAVSAVDISKSFVDITLENARNAGVTIDVRQGNASEMPLEDGRFDYVVCMAAFKNFTDPLGALNEMHRVLAPGGQASIFDLRKDASLEDIDAGVRGLQLSAWNAFVTRWVFRTWLLKKAYTRENLEQMAMSSRFHGGEIFADGIGFELRLRKE